MGSASRRMIGVLGLGMFGLGLAVGGFGAYVSELVERGVDPATAGLGSTLFLLGQLSIVLPVDSLSRRWSIRSVTAVGLLLGVVGTVLGGVLRVPVHLGSRLLLGAANGIVFLLVIKYAGLRVDGGSVARVQGLLGALFTLGLAVGIATTPSAVAAVGPLVPAALASVPILCSGALVLSLQPVTTQPAVRLSSYLDPFRTAHGIALGLANAASYGLLIVAITWYTDIVGTVPALPVTLVLSGFAVATFAGRTGSGWLTVVTSERGAVGGSLLFLAAALALVAVGLRVDAAPLLVVALVLTGFGFGLPFGPLFSLAFARVGSDAGVLLVGMTALGNAAALAYPWLVGWLLGVTDGYVVGFAIMSLSVLAVTALWQRAVDAP